jgi:hypothetical protein
MKSYDSEGSPADEATAEFEEGLMDGWQALESHAQSSELMQPRDGAFDHTTGFAQATAVCSVSTSDLSVDPPLGQKRTQGVRIVGAIGVDPSEADIAVYR